MKWPKTLLTVAAVAVLAFLYVRHPPESSSDFAAWVQALGSVVAIFAAVKVVNIQHELELERAAAEDQSRRAEALQAWSGLFNAVAGHVAECRKFISTQDNSPWRVSDILDAVAACTEAAERLNTAPLNGWQELEPAVTGIALCRRLRTHLTETLRRMPKGEPWVSHLDVTTRDLEQKLVDCATALTP